MPLLCCVLECGERGVEVFVGACVLGIWTDVWALCVFMWSNVINISSHAQLTVTLQVKSDDGSHEHHAQ